jgi:hypothetical protein
MFPVQLYQGSLILGVCLPLYILISVQVLRSFTMGRHGSFNAAMQNAIWDAQDETERLRKENKKLRAQLKALERKLFAAQRQARKRR